MVRVSHLSTFHQLIKKLMAKWSFLIAMFNASNSVMMINNLCVLLRMDLSNAVSRFMT